MKSKFHLNLRFATIGLVATPAIAGTAAVAGEKSLEFQLVTKAIDPKSIEVPNIENQTITQGKAFGVAVFKDGRTAIKDFVFVSDLNKGIGTSFGYSTYTFDDGSSITAKWALEPKSGHGEYANLSGTGAYAGAAGSGTFERAPSQFKNVGFYNVRLKITTP